MLLEIKILQKKRCNRTSLKKAEFLNLITTAPYKSKIGVISRLTSSLFTLNLLIYKYIQNHVGTTRYGM